MTAIEKEPNEQELEAKYRDAIAYLQLEVSSLRDRVKSLEADRKNLMRMLEEFPLFCGFIMKHDKRLRKLENDLYWEDD